MRPVRTPASISLATVLAAFPASTFGGGMLGAQDAAAGAAAAQPAAQSTTPATAPQPSDEVQALFRDRLSRSLAARARIVLQREIVFLGVLENSKALMRMALAGTPDNPFIWRLALDLAAVLEDGDPDAATWLSDGLAKLSKLDPDDEIIRLRRLLDVIERKQLAEDRVAASESLLTPEAVERIGPRVAARIAFDLAMLLRRTGDMGGFERNLIRALDLDPYFPEAAELAAGYFRIHAPTLGDEVRALRGALLANPTRPSTAMSLAQICLEHGAYAPAEAILSIQAELQQARGVDETYDAVLSDYLLALWGNDKASVAFVVASERQKVLDRTLLAEIERQGMQITMEERSKVHLPTAPMLATTVAAMASSMGVKSAPVAVSNVAVSFDAMLDQLTKRKADASQIAAVALESAMMQLWLGGSLDKAQTLISKSADYGPMSDTARARFDGWVAYRQKDPAKAKSLLQPIVDKDQFAKLGMALILEEEGDRKEAARHYLEVARAQPSTSVGLWSSTKLFALLGTRAEINPDAAAVTAAATLPPAFLRLMELGGDAMLLRVMPAQTEARGWDPLIFNIEITNRSSWPLAVGPEGPIKDSTTVSASINIPGEMPAAPQIIILPIDRLYLIEPGETLRVPIDISVTDASVALRDDALSGAFVSLHSIVNWKTTPTGFEPSALGLEVESPVTHVSGERVTKAWVEGALAQLRDASRVPDPELIALLSSALVRKTSAPAMVPADAVAALEGAGKVIADATKRLWPEARGWLVFACPKGKRIERGKEAQDLLDVVATGGVELAAAVPELEELDAVLRADESPTVRIPWIAVRVRRPEDPTLVASLESKDPAVRSYAENCKQWLIEARDERAKQLNLKK